MTHPADGLPPWMSHAACIDEPRDWWFAFGGDDHRALRVCAGCPVRVNCAEWAIATNQQHGIWGGLTQDQLAAIRRQRREARQ